MSERGEAFADNWVSENINAEGYEPEGDRVASRRFVEVMLTEAEALGISREEIEEYTGDLVEFIAEAIEDANDREVHRLADKDD